MVCYSSCSRDSLFYEQSTNLVKGVRRPIGHTTRKRETSGIRRTPTYAPRRSEHQLPPVQEVYNYHTTRKRETPTATKTTSTNTTGSTQGRGKTFKPWRRTPTCPSLSWGKVQHHYAELVCHWGKVNFYTGLHLCCVDKDCKSFSSEFFLIRFRNQSLVCWCMFICPVGRGGIVRIGDILKREPLTIKLATWLPQIYTWKVCNKNIVEMELKRAPNTKSQIWGSGISLQRKVRK